MKTKIFFFFLIALKLVFFNAYAADQGISFDDFNARTIAGVLEIKKKIREPDRVYLAGNVILQTDADHYSWFVASAFPRQGDARLVLLGFDTGVNACQYLYRVLEIHTNGKYSMSKDFGNCQPFEDPEFSTAPSAVKDSVRYSDKKWMLAFSRDDRNGITWYSYKNGKVYIGNKIAPEPDY
jgi:hypothetical protein